MHQIVEKTKDFASPIDGVCSGGLDEARRAIPAPPTTVKARRDPMFLRQRRGERNLDAVGMSVANRQKRAASKDITTERIYGKCYTKKEQIMSTQIHGKIASATSSLISSFDNNLHRIGKYARSTFKSIMLDKKNIR